jgi:hypothetical protein
MKALICTAMILGLANATNTWYNWKTTVAGLPNWLAISVSYKFPLWYGTTYHSGEGPYYSKNLFTSIDKNMHYEELGFLVNSSFAATIQFDIGTPLSEIYEYKFKANAELLTINPFRQVVYWSRPEAEMINNGAASQNTYVAGAYQIDIGHFFLKYCEGVSTGATNLWEAIDGTTPYWNQYGASYGQYSTCWKDSVYNIDLATKLPSSFT